MFIVCALYKFVDLPDYESLRAPLLDLMGRDNIRGTILLASEGVNGTVTGERLAVDKLLAWFARDDRFAGMQVNESIDTEMPFYRGKVKLKKEIVTIGVEGLEPNKIVGEHVAPKDWNQLISDPSVLLIDTRNEYEIKIGSFRNAVDPHTNSFREFPKYVEEHLDRNKHRKVAMFCTGGIRCEKSSAYLKAAGFEEVYHLEGGILNYLREVPREESLWEGECFVFDNRVTVDHNLAKGHYDQCHACRRPITHADKSSNKYVKGERCPHCYNTKSEKARSRFREREKQVQLARSRGEAHLGSDAIKAQTRHRQEKLDARNVQGMKHS